MAVVSAEEHAEEVARLEAALAERDREIAVLKEQVQALLAKLDQNSSNSNLPPSSDGPGAASRGVRPTKKGKGAKRKRGGQKGRRGTRRELLPPDRVHEFVDYFAEACERCASPLPRKRGCTALAGFGEVVHELVHAVRRQKLAAGATSSLLPAAFALGTLAFLRGPDPARGRPGAIAGRRQVRVAGVLVELGEQGLDLLLQHRDLAVSLGESRFEASHLFRVLLGTDDRHIEL